MSFVDHKRSLVDCSDGYFREIEGVSVGVSEETGEPTIRVVVRTDRDAKPVAELSISRGDLLEWAQTLVADSRRDCGRRNK